MLSYFTLSSITKTTGAMFLSYQLLYKPFRGVYNHFIRQPFNLTQRYGDKTWVLITGGSDGIGKGKLHELKHSFQSNNLCQS